MARVRVVLSNVATVLVLTACGGEEGPTQNGNGNSSFTATIGGQAWASNGAPYLQVNTGGVAGTLVIQGQQLESAASYRTIVLVLGRIEGPGTYPMGVDGSTVAGGSGTVLVAAGGAPTSWVTPLSGAAGTVTVTSLTSTRVVGDFVFTAHPLPGQQGANQSVTNGHFDLALPSGFVPATGSTRASRMSATIGGETWNAAVVTPVGQLPVVVLGGGNTTTYQLQITPYPGISSGLFPLAQGTTVSIFQVGAPNGWGSAGASTGSVTITSFANNRVAGNFEVNLTPIGQAGGNLAASGTFDINLALAN